MNSALPTLIFLAPFVSALLVAAIGWWIRGAARTLAFAGLAVTTALSVFAAVRVFTGSPLHSHLGNWAPPIGIELVLDPLSAILAVLVSGTAFLALAGSTTTVHAELASRCTSYYATALLLIAGLLGIVVTGDLFNLFVQLEVASLSAYALVAAGKRGAPKAALNYLLIGSLGASLYLTGVGFLYAATGSLNMSDVAARLGDGPLALTGAVLIAIGLAVKMALFPLHGWMPAAYATAPSAAAALMAPLVTKVAAYALIRVLFWVYGAASLQSGAAMPRLMETLGWAGAAAIVAGGVFAYLQKDLWRLLAYSSVSQVGIVAVGVSLVNANGLTGAILHIANDALMKGALFLAAGVALAGFGVRRIDQLGALRGRAPWTIGIVAVAGMSLIGLPPLGGFFGKWYVLLGALESGHGGFAAAILAGTLITAAYVFRILEPMLFAKHEDGVREDLPGDGMTRGESREVSLGGRATIAAGVVFAVLIVALGLLNAPVVTLLVRTALPEGL
jgi:multicomponent Na+:H+ antiporter subunit D